MTGFCYRHPGNEPPLETYTPGDIVFADRWRRTLTRRGRKWSDTGWMREILGVAITPFLVQTGGEALVRLLDNEHPS